MIMRTAIQPHTLRTQAGFTLIEIAIVLVVVAFLSAGALMAFGTQVELSRRLETRTQLENARDAAQFWAASNTVTPGALPCPAISAESGEAAPTCADALATKGFLPWKTLGLPSRDAFGQTLRYAIACRYAKTPALGSLGTIKLIRRDVDGSKSDLSSGDSVAFAVWSIGSDGISESDTSAATEIVAESSGDDLVIAVSRFVLLNKLQSSGLLLAIGTTACS